MSTVLLAGTGPWSDTLDELLRARGLRPLRATNLPEVKVCARHVRPQVSIIGPALSYADMIRSFLEIRDANPSAYVVVALDRDDRDFGRDLLAIGVPAMALVPIGLAGIADEAKRLMDDDAESTVAA